MRLLPLLFAALIHTSPGIAGDGDLDLAFVIDSTGSMSGEIREAKERVRDIATALAAARPGARLRIGVVAYRDRGDEYLTRVSPLAGDVASSFDFLAALHADGGGDGPEDVVAGIEATLHELAWDEQSAAERLVLLVGDAPPHLDYPDSPPLPDLLAEARARRIVFHAVGCRSLPPGGVAFFRELARATEGSYHHIGLVHRTAGVAPPVTTPTLAAAVLEAAGAPATPVRVDLATRKLAGDARALVVEPLLGPGGACALAVELPPGLGLAAYPEVAARDRGGEVVLAVAAGTGADGERLLYHLDPCLPPGPVHVDVKE